MKGLFNVYLLVFVLFSISSCVKDPIEQIDFEVPAEYIFTRNGESTVTFPGQTTRILMAEELSSVLTNMSESKEVMINMYNNTENPFMSDDLNNSSKDIRSKVAASYDYFNSNVVTSIQIKSELENWIIKMVDETAAAVDQIAAPGVSGQIADGEFTRYVNAKGLEYNQAFEKSLTGALMTDQMLNNYLSPSVLDAGANRSENDNEIVVEDKNYTVMEHKWDEAYGYLFGKSADVSEPLNTLGTDDIFLNKYLGRVNNDPDFEGIGKEIFDALKTGRAAITEGSYEVRDQQADIIQELVSKVIAIRCVYYLEQGIKAFNDGKYGTAFHDWSEGYGFIYSLQFTQDPTTNQPYFSRAEVEQMLDQLMEGNGFWDVKGETIEALSKQIAAEFDFTVQQAAE